MENLNTAFLLMAVGMLTVFAILLIVINMGKLLIHIVNKYFPEQEAAPAKRQKPESKDAIPAPTLAAISAAISIVTKGTGHVTNIERI